MLEEKDLQAITQLMAQLLTQQKQEIMQDIEQKMARQKQEILAESTHNMQVLIDAEIRPQFNLLAEQIHSNTPEPCAAARNPPGAYDYKLHP